MAGERVSPMYEPGGRVSEGDTLDVLVEFSTTFWSSGEFGI